MPRYVVSLLFVLAGILLCSSSALANPPDYASSSELIEENGFPGVCEAPCFVAAIEVEVWLPGNPGNPLPLSGHNTYIYKLTHSSGSGPFVPALTSFELAVDTSKVTDAGHLEATPGVAPDGVVVGPATIDWTFNSTPIGSDASAKQLYIHSTLMPGAVDNNVASVDAQAGLTAVGSCLGPLDEPVVAQCNLILEQEACVVQPPDVVGDACVGKVTSFAFTYTGEGCDATSHLQNPRKVSCIGGVSDTDPVDILVSGKRRKRWSWDAGWWGNLETRKVIFSSETGVQVGDTIVVDAAAAGRSRIGGHTGIMIAKADGSHELLEMDHFRTNCSQPFGPGMVFGSIQITSVTSSYGGTVDLPEEEEECVDEIDVVPAPHCLGKIKSLALRYTGGDCSQTLTTQGPGKVKCTDVAAPTANPVRITLADGKNPPPDSFAYVDELSVQGGEIVEADAPLCGRGSLTSATGFWIRDAVTDELIQEGFFHTSCSQPLDLGNQIGALQVYALDASKGGTAALGSEVEYSFQVTNPNTETANQVAVEDTLLGTVANGISIASGETQTFTTRLVLEGSASNQGTATGEVGGLSCTPGEDGTQIGVATPPEEAKTCTRRLSAFLLQYTGPDILGADIEIEAKSFRHDQVTYSGVDLTTGTILSLPEENGFTIDGAAHGEAKLGNWIKVRINGDEETLRTSCSLPITVHKPAKLNDPMALPSAKWWVVDFNEKQRR
jgi:hypothetical protein